MAGSLRRWRNEVARLRSDAPAYFWWRARRGPVPAHVAILVSPLKRALIRALVQIERSVRRLPGSLSSPRAHRKLGEVEKRVLRK